MAGALSGAPGKQVKDHICLSTKTNTIQWLVLPRQGPRHIRCKYIHLEGSSIALCDDGHGGMAGCGSYELGSGYSEA